MSARRRIYVIEVDRRPMEACFDRAAAESAIQAHSRARGVARIVPYGPLAGRKEGARRAARR